MVKFEIYNFYSKQHIRRDISFEDQDREQKMDKGELTGFCRDFMMLPPKSKIHEVFRLVSPLQQPLNFEQFKKTLPILAMQFAKFKITETKYRLRELKYVLEYPTNQPAVNLTDTLENLINGVTEKYDKLGRKIITKRK